MDSEKKLLIEKLRKKSSLLPKERATLKNLERAAKKESKADVNQNVFATQATTNIAPLPVRFTQAERSGLTELANDIKNQNKVMVIDQLGSERDINDTKLLKAAIFLMKQNSHEEIIKAIKQVKLNMIR